MIVTQRQLEGLLKLHGRIVLPYRARLSPMAQDYARHRKIEIGYGAVESVEAPKPSLPGAVAIPGRSDGGRGGERFVWWSDGADGVAKAAIGMAAREAKLEPMTILEDATKTIAAVRTLNRAVATGGATGGVLVVKTAGPALVIANKASALRAVVASSLAAVDEAINTVAANVLVVEREKSSLYVLRNILARFCRGGRTVDSVLSQELAELSATPVAGR
ncbi:MAG TPA: hypothetical protein VF624_17525 [Tepidisphaeraceae bacterium]